MDTIEKMKDPFSVTYATVGLCIMALGMMAPVAALASLDPGSTMMQMIAMIALHVLIGGVVMGTLCYASYAFVNSTREDRGESGFLTGDFIIFAAALVLGVGAMVGAATFL